MWNNPATGVLRIREDQRVGVTTVGHTAGLLCAIGERQADFDFAGFGGRHQIDGGECHAGFNGERRNEFSAVGYVLRMAVALLDGVAKLDGVICRVCHLG